MRRGKRRLPPGTFVRIAATGRTVVYRGGVSHGSLSVTRRSPVPRGRRGACRRPVSARDLQGTVIARTVVLGAALSTSLVAAVSVHAAEGTRALAPDALRGSAHRLEQYPTPSLASARERAAAEALLREVRSAALRWLNPADAGRAGYSTRTRSRRPGDRSVHWFHAERQPGPPSFDPSRPKAIIYANAPGRSLVLVGMMFAMPRGARGPNPGGPITRWHTHSVCARGGERGKAPPRNGPCPPGTRVRQGSEMMHVWLTNDLRSAFAIHAPVPELCLAGLLPDASCGNRKREPLPLGRARSRPASEGTAKTVSALSPAVMRMLCVIAPGVTPRGPDALDRLDTPATPTGQRRAASLVDALALRAL
jgi:hypothetical protein